MSNSKDKPMALFQFLKVLFILIRFAKKTNFSTPYVFIYKQKHLFSHATEYKYFTTFFCQKKISISQLFLFLLYYFGSWSAKRRRDKEKVTLAFKTQTADQLDEDIGSLS